MERPSDAREQQIAEWIREGEPRGFALLMEHYGGRVVGYLRRRFPSLDEHDVHDATADAMLAVADSFDARRGSLAAWFLMLAHQRAAQRLRAQRAAPPWAGELGDARALASDGTPLEQLVTQERLDEVHAIIASLSTLERAVVMADLEDGGGVPAEELAARLRTTVGSVYAARRRARHKLLARCRWIRDWLGAEGTAHGETT